MSNVVSTTERLTVSVKTAMAMLDISRPQIYRLFDNGSLPRRKLGAKTLIPYSAVCALADGLPAMVANDFSHTEKSGSSPPVPQDKQKRPDRKPTRTHAAEVRGVA